MQESVKQFCEEQEIIIDRNELLEVLSEALDRVEIDVFGVTEHHAKRVAWLSAQMGMQLGMTAEEVSDIATSALLHDSALIAYKQDYTEGVLRQDADGRKHCIDGEENLKLIPGYHMLRGYVLYHHECADGSGPFKQKEEETPLGAQLIHIADEVDLKFALGTECENLDEKLQQIQEYVKEQQGVLFGKKVSEAFLNILSKEQLFLTRDAVMKYLKESLLPIKVSFSKKESNLLDLAELFARIIDYKSPFTKNHSIGIAEKAKQMAASLGYPEETCTKLYFAGALHDVGKLFIDPSVLEKPGRLEAEEYQHIQTHAEWTWKLLGKIQGFEEIKRWASYHHEKLNGKGYPFGKTAEELGTEERLLTCLDIYQALTEDRPYKAGMVHKKAIGILKEMAEKGELDADIIEQMDKKFGNGEETEVQKTALFSCGICGYVHETDLLSDEFVCPVCGAKATVFSRML